ncbi:MAG: hypothetical protein CMJ79_04365 [Planctomycetaceae bacterium]|nr:hypothetical protein [Planctomycetaceae bacterium]|tara:strand:+ start:2580 stop:3533 length:954 start_codon:yes stop_codon:yes gene_type:complete
MRPTPAITSTESIDNAAKRVIISLNPKAGSGPSGQLAQQLQEILTQQGYDALLETDLKTVVALAQNAVASNSLRCVVGVGGDGTQTLLLNELPAEANLCVFPQGTENVLAKYFRLPATPEQVANLVINGRVARIDAGRITEATGDSKLFCLMVGCGVDAAIVHQLAANRTGHITKMSYLHPIWKVIRKYEYPRLLVSSPEWGDEILDARVLFIMNIDRYALGISMTPKIRPQDGKLGICAFKKRGLFHMLKYFLLLLTNRHHKRKDCVIRYVNEVHVRSEDMPDAPTQIDGDPCGTLPVTIETVPARLRLVIPPTTD